MNPRFVWAVGDYRAEFPDMPDDLDVANDLVLWDRQEKKRVATVHGHYSQLLCLERTYVVDGAPFTTLESWLNALDDDALESEGIPPTTAK